MHSMRIERDSFIDIRTFNPVTAANADLAEYIFGPNIAALKGKKTCRQTGALIDDQIQTPKKIPTI